MVGRCSDTTDQDPEKKVDPSKLKTVQDVTINNNERDNVCSDSERH